MANPAAEETRKCPTAKIPGIGINFTKKMIGRKGTQRAQKRMMNGYGSIYLLCEFLIG